MGQALSLEHCGGGKYTGHFNMDSPGNDIRNVGAGDLCNLVRQCDADPQCRGFNVNGWLKHNASGRVSQPGTNLYTKDAPPPPPQPIPPPPQVAPTMSGGTFYLDKLSDQNNMTGWWRGTQNTLHIKDHGSEIEVTPSGDYYMIPSYKMTVRWRKPGIFSAFLPFEGGLRELTSNNYQTVELFDSVGDVKQNVVLLTRQSPVVTQPAFTGALARSPIRTMSPAVMGGALLLILAIAGGIFFYHRQKRRQPAFQKE